jgi:RNA polymerase sigma factor (sigma-70 family)
MNMDLLELVEHVSAGGQEHMDELVKAVQPRVRAYILRCTLNEDLTEDILQETMLQLLISIKSLKNPDRFWPWLYKIASNKIISHFRKDKYRPSIRFSAMEDYRLESALEDTSNPDSDKPALQEMVSLVIKSMETLTTPQRSILALRCFEGLQYHQIAEAVGCSESTARVQFLRARKKIKSALARNGYSRKAALPALILFGKLTAGQKALAATITASTVVFETGLTTTQVVVAGLKAYFLHAAAATAATVAVIAIVHTFWIRTHPSPFPPRHEVRSVQYTVQGIGLLQEDNIAVAVLPANRSRKGDVDVGPYYSKGAYEQWLRFPEGPDGPMLVRMQRWSIDKTEKLCGWLQNGRANYYYHSGEKQIYITNDPVGMLILPTDPPEMVDFITQHTDYQDNIQYTYDRRTKLSKAKIDNRVPSVKDYTTEYVYNSLTEQDFEPFWPPDTGVIDQRDPMHYRGWTYFTIEGRLGDLQISGQGRLPFSYTAYLDQAPWLQVRIGDRLSILDTPDGACMLDEKSGQVTHYPPGTFFTGLGRPWTGIRAFDTLRRDAAKDRIPFTAERFGEFGIVSLQRKLGPDTYEIEYMLNMSKDIIDTINLTRSGEDPTSGKLTLTYAQQLTDLPGPFEQPTLPQPHQKPDQTDSTPWLLTLLENTNLSPAPAKPELAVSK